MKALLTGVSGQVGQALLDSAPAGIELIACSHAELDLGDEQAVMHCVRRHRPDAILNAAAYTAVDRAESEAELARRVNGAGPGYLARAAGEQGARLLHVSTDFVFDGSSATPYPPDAPTRPLNVYGASKLAGENAVLQALPRQAVIVRTAWVYAAKGRNFVNTMLRLMRDQGTVRVVADQIGTPTAACSVAEALWHLLARPEIHGIHHWTDAGVASWYDFAVAIAEEAVPLGLLSGPIRVTPIRTADYPSAARRPSFSVLDKESLIATGLRPIHWRARLRDVLGELRHA